MNETTTIETLSRENALAKIKSIAGRSGTLRNDIDLVARAAFLHAAEHGDFTIATKLHAAVSRSYQSDLKRYFTTFGPVYFDAKKGAFAKVRKGGSWDMIALETPFDAVPKAEKPAAAYDRKKLLTSIVKFLDTKADQALNADDAAMTAVLVDVAGLLTGLVDQANDESEVA